MRRMKVKVPKIEEKMNVSGCSVWRQLWKRLFRHPSNVKGRNSDRNQSSKQDQNIPFVIEKVRMHQTHMHV